MSSNGNLPSGDFFAVLSALVGHLDGQPLRLYLQVGEAVVKVSVRPADSVATSPAPADPDVKPLTLLEEDIIALCRRSEGPLKGRTVASRLGRSYSSHLKDTLAEMVREGRLLRGRKSLNGEWVNGYVLPAAPAASPAPAVRPEPSAPDRKPGQEAPQNGKLSNAELAQRIAAARAAKATNGHTIGNLDGEGR